MASQSIRIEGLQGVLATLRQLPPEIVSRNGGPVRASLRKAAQVIQREMQGNLDGIIAAQNADGESVSTGLLRKNIVITRGKRPSNGETMLVRVRNKRYPMADGRKPVSTAQVARLLEYGTAKRAPMPFIRPAFATKKEEAVNVFTTDILKRIASIQKKLERANRVKT